MNGLAKGKDSGTTKRFKCPVELIFKHGEPSERMASDHRLIYFQRQRHPTVLVKPEQKTGKTGLADGRKDYRPVGEHDSS